MNTGQTHLFIPGPTNIPEDVRQAIEGVADIAEVAVA